MTTETPTIVEIDCSTGEAITRPMTAEEIAAHEQAVAENAVYQAQEKALKDARDALKASAKAKLIAGEPLTEEEASVLVI